jgi:hypothetical protein
VEKPKTFVAAVNQELARGLALPEAIRAAKEKNFHLYRDFHVRYGGQPDPRFPPSRGW